MAVTGTYGEMIKSTNYGATWSTMVYRRSLANMNGEIYAQSGNGRIIACRVNLEAMMFLFHRTGCKLEYSGFDC
jgi:hypothetical protein